MRDAIIEILKNGDDKDVGRLADMVIALFDSSNARHDEADMDEQGNPLPADEGCSLHDPDYRNLCMDCGRLFWTKLSYAVHCPKCIEEERYKK